jgi:N-acetyl-beta-hexosaminidase
MPNEPFFGYFRGPYTQTEFKAMDDYAWALGIELVPLIQTLGHLAQMLQWPRYQHMQDTADVLLAESDQVYALIEKMITTVSAPLRTKKIHIGMDEAFGLGEGRFKQARPESRWKDGTRIFLDHLKRVNAICKRKGLTPLIWSDSSCLCSHDNSLI